MINPAGEGIRDIPKVDETKHPGDIPRRLGRHSNTDNHDTSFVALFQTTSRTPIIRNRPLPFPNQLFLEFLP